MVKIALALFILSLAACSNHKPMPSPPAKINKTDAPKLKKLLSHYNEWRGVKYLIGGNTKQGIDCSGFVYLAFKKKLNKNLPRTTQSMAKVGTKISRKNIKIGDVVFFKTGINIRHVGIYVGRNEFIHASTSRGVTKSNLNNPYWLNAYWMTRRF